MRVETIMSSPVISVSPATSVSEAARLMLSHRISGLPVLGPDGALLGVISEGDLMRRGELGTTRQRSWWLELLTSPGKLADEYVRSHGRKVEELMSRDVACIARGATLQQAVDLMSRRGVKRLPVVDGGTLIGIIARSDLLRALACALPAEPGPSEDERIRRTVQTELDGQPWAANGLIRVHVHDGVAELSGSIFDERARLAARVVAENVAGVTAVDDQLIWIDPASGIVLAPPARKTAAPG
ncbi:MAG: CBS domain-containing protein [Bosea sp. (in: a-proteobacteria)]